MYVCRQSFGADQHTVTGYSSNSISFSRMSPDLLTDVIISLWEPQRKWFNEICFKFLLSFDVKACDKWTNLTSCIIGSSSLTER